MKSAETILSKIPLRNGARGVGDDAGRDHPPTTLRGAATSKNGGVDIERDGTGSVRGNDGQRSMLPAPRSTVPGTRAEGGENPLDAPAPICIGAGSSNDVIDLFSGRHRHLIPVGFPAILPRCSLRPILRAC